MSLSTKISPSLAALAALLLLIAIAACDSGPGSNILPETDDDEKTQVLKGNPDAPAAMAVPDLAYEPRPEDYSDTHPELPGIFLSHNVLLLVFEPQTTVGEANELLSPLDGEVIGGIAGATEADNELTSGILYLRVPTDSHEAMEQLLDEMRADARVAVAIQDGLLEPTRVTKVAPATAGDWRWDATPQGGNWGLELARVPQMWNVLDGVWKALDAAGSPAFQAVPTAVIDVGFAHDHEDLLRTVVGDQLGVEADHGTHVAGIIGALFDSQKGIDGVNPLAELLYVWPGWRSVEDPIARSMSYGEVMSQAAFLLGLGATEDSDIARPWVINMSLAYGWAAAGISSNQSPAAQRITRAQGGIFAQMLQLIDARTASPPLVITSAGNESNAGFGVQNAQWNDPMCNAALEHGASNILVVEAVGLDPSAPGSTRRAAFSNVGGHLSAPGENILSTITKNGYGLMSGTSMAAPFVSGLVGFMLAAEPTLSAGELRRLLTENAIPAGDGASPRVDAFASVMAIDGLSRISDTPIRRMLLDIDDGTPDGNLRVNPDGSLNEERDADSDGWQGDGAIDMSDFRRFRDGLLQVENAPTLALDGPGDHPKKDLNGDREVKAPADENLYPRGDFNGSGDLSRAGTAEVPGFPSPVTDLEVLQSLFEDSDYAKSDLPGLLDSFDLEVNADACLRVPGALSARFSMTPLGTSSPVQEGQHDASRPIRLYTVPIDSRGHMLKLEALGGGDVVLAQAEKDLSAPGLGADESWAPEACGATGTIEGEVVLDDGSGVADVTMRASRADGLETTTVTGSDGAFRFEALAVFGLSEMYEVTPQDLPPRVTCSPASQMVDLPRDETREVRFECVEREVPTGPFHVRVEFPGVDNLGQFLAAPPFFGQGYNVILTNQTTEEEFLMLSDSARPINSDPPAHSFQFSDIPVGPYEVDIPLREGCSTEPPVPVEVEHEEGPVISTSVDVEMRCE